MTDERQGTRSAFPGVTYLEAAVNGASMPNTNPAHGSIIPILGQKISDVPSLGIAGVSRGFSAGSFTRPPTLTPIARTVAEIAKAPAAIGPSILGTLFNATPLSNIASIANDLPGSEHRPLIPPGLRDRAVSALPPGMRQRAAAWARVVARWQSNRPTFGSRISRE